MSLAGGLTTRNTTIVITACVLGGFVAALVATYSVKFVRGRKAAQRKASAASQGGGPAAAAAAQGGGDGSATPLK